MKDEIKRETRSNDSKTSYMGSMGSKPTTPVCLPTEESLTLTATPPHHMQGLFSLSFLLPPVHIGIRDRP